jgi:hypothetical protein
MSAWLLVWVGVGIAVCFYLMGRIDGEQEADKYIKNSQAQLDELAAIVKRTVALSKEKERLLDERAQLRMMPIVGSNGTAKHEE